VCRGRFIADVTDCRGRAVGARLAGARCPRCRCLAVTARHRKAPGHRHPTTGGNCASETVHQWQCMGAGRAEIARAPPGLAGSVPRPATGSSCAPVKLRACETNGNYVTAEATGPMGRPRWSPPSCDPTTDPPICLPAEVRQAWKPADHMTAGNARILPIRVQLVRTLTSLRVVYLVGGLLRAEIGSPAVPPAVRCGGADVGFPDPKGGWDRGSGPALDRCPS